ncbi:MAG: tol-pal system protein YbgF, partial [Pararhizobium sp.]
MKAIVKAALVGSAALVAVPSASHAFSLRSALGMSRPSQQDVVPPAAVGSGQPTVVLAQAAGDATVRLQQLEDSVRQLTGRVEDLNYQLLQMQEQMRQMQKDNEFRFQQLEGGGHAGGGGGGTAAGAPSPDRSETGRPAAPGNDLARGALPRVAPAKGPS